MFPPLHTVPAQEEHAAPFTQEVPHLMLRALEVLLRLGLEIQQSRLCQKDKSQATQDTPQESARRCFHRALAVAGAQKTRVPQAVL